MLSLVGSKTYPGSMVLAACSCGLIGLVDLASDLAILASYSASLAPHFTHSSHFLIG